MPVSPVYLHCGDLGSIPGFGRSLKEGMTTHSSVLAWRIPWTEEPGGLQSMGLQSKSRTEQLTLTYTSWVKGVKRGTSLHTGLAQLLQPSYCSIFYHQKNF